MSRIPTVVIGLLSSSRNSIGRHWARPTLVAVVRCLTGFALRVTNCTETVARSGPT